MSNKEAPSCAFVESKLCSSSSNGTSPTWLKRTFHAFFQGCFPPFTHSSAGTSMQAYMNLPPIYPISTLSLSHWLQGFVTSSSSSSSLGDSTPHGMHQKKKKKKKSGAHDSAIPEPTVACIHGSCPVESFPFFLLQESPLISLM